MLVYPRVPFDNIAIVSPLSSQMHQYPLEMDPESGGALVLHGNFLAPMEFWALPVEWLGGLIVY